MSNIAEVLTIKRTLDSFKGIPWKLRPLLETIILATKGGRQPAWASAAWYAKQIGRGISTYYRHRATLIKLGLIAVTQRRIAPKQSDTSLIRLLQPVRTATKRMWEKLALIPPPTLGRQKSVLNQNCSVRSKPELQKQYALQLLDQFAPSRMTLAEAMRSSRPK